MNLSKMIENFLVWMVKAAIIPKTIDVIICFFFYYVLPIWSIMKFYSPITAVVVALTSKAGLMMTFNVLAISIALGYLYRKKMRAYLIYLKFMKENKDVYIYKLRNLHTSHIVARSEMPILFAFSLFNSIILGLILYNASFQSLVNSFGHLASNGHTYVDNNSIYFSNADKSSLFYTPFLIAITFYKLLIRHLLSFYMHYVFYPLAVFFIYYVLNVIISILQFPLDFFDYPFFILFNLVSYCFSISLYPPLNLYNMLVTSFSFYLYNFFICKGLINCFPFLMDNYYLNLFFYALGNYLIVIFISIIIETYFILKFYNLAAPIKVLSFRVLFFFFSIELLHTFILFPKYYITKYTTFCSFYYLWVYNFFMCKGLAFYVPPSLHTNLKLFFIVIIHFFFCIILYIIYIPNLTLYKKINSKIIQFASKHKQLLLIFFFQLLLHPCWFKLLSKFIFDNTLLNMLINFHHFTICKGLVTNFPNLSNFLLSSNVIFFIIMFYWLLTLFFIFYFLMFIRQGEIILIFTLLNLNSTIKILVKFIILFFVFLFTSHIYIILINFLINNSLLFILKLSIELHNFFICKGLVIDFPSSLNITSELLFTFVVFGYIYTFMYLIMTYELLVFYFLLRLNPLTTKLFFKLVFWFCLFLLILHIPTLLVLFTKYYIIFTRYYTIPMMKYSIILTYVMAGDGLFGLLIPRFYPFSFFLLKLWVIFMVNLFIGFILYGIYWQLRLRWLSYKYRCFEKKLIDDRIGLYEFFSLDNLIEIGTYFRWLAVNYCALYHYSFRLGPKIFNARMESALKELFSGKFLIIFFILLFYLIIACKLFIELFAFYLFYLNKISFTWSYFIVNNDLSLFYNLNSFYDKFTSTLEMSFFIYDFCFLSLFLISILSFFFTLIGFDNSLNYLNYLDSEAVPINVNIFMDYHFTVERLSLIEELSKKKNIVLIFFYKIIWIIQIPSDFIEILLLYLFTFFLYIINFFLKIWFYFHFFWLDLVSFSFWIALFFVKPFFIFWVKSMFFVIPLIFNLYYYTLIPLFFFIVLKFCMMNYNFSLFWLLLLLIPETKLFSYPLHSFCAEFLDLSLFFFFIFFLFDCLVNCLFLYLYFFCFYLFFLFLYFFFLPLYNILTNLFLFFYNFFHFFSYNMLKLDIASQLSIYIWIIFIIILLPFFILKCWGSNTVEELNSSHAKKVIFAFYWGTFFFVVSEVMVFFGGFWAYFHFFLNPTTVSPVDSMCPPIGLESVGLWGFPLVNTFLLILSGFTVTLSHWALRERRVIYFYLYLVKTILLGCIFLILQYREYSYAKFCLQDGCYGSIFFLLTGLHGFHVLVGIILLILCLLRSNSYTRKQHIGFRCAIIYWHFIDVVWILLMEVVYIWGNGHLG